MQKQYEILTIYLFKLLIIDLKRKTSKLLEIYNLDALEP